MRNFLRTKFLIGFVLSCIVFTTQHSNAQWTPPTSSNTTVMVNGFSQIVNPNATSFINANFEFLSAGAGITGNNFNGSTAQTWRLDTNWLDLNYANDLTSGSPILTFTNGGLYDGKANAQIGIDSDEFSLEVKKTAFVVDGYQAKIDTTPSVNPFDPTETAQSSVTINTPYSQLSNLDFRAIHFGNEGIAKCTSVQVQPTVFSLARRIKMSMEDFASLSQLGVIEGNDVGANVNSGISIRRYQSEEALLGFYIANNGSLVYSIAINSENTKKIFDGKWHDFIVCSDGVNVKIFLDGELLQTTTYSIPTIETPSSVYTFGSSNTNGLSFADIQNFNFDMSAENSPYSVADYHAGKDIPIELNPIVMLINPSVGGGILDQFYNSSIATMSKDENGYTIQTTEVSGETNCIIHQKVKVGLPVNFKLGNLVNGGNLRIRFYYNDGTNETFTFSTTGELTTTAQKSVKEVRLLVLAYSTSPATITFDSFSMTQDSLILALENDISLLSVSGTPTKIIMNNSENNNYATVSGAIKTVYDPEGFMESYANLQFPTKDENGNPYQTTYTFQYEVPKLTYWTDGEFKVLDNEGNLVYWVSTQRGAQMGGNYDTNPATDLNAKIFYTVSERKDPENREWVEFVYNETNARTIYEHAQTTFNLDTPTIGGIIVQPNMSGNTVGGTSIKSIFGTIQANTNAGYSYVYARTSPTSVEKDVDGNFIWRPVLPKPIQKNY